MSTVVFVVVLVAGILATLMVVSGAILVWIRRRRRVIASRLDAELAAETIIRSPEPGSYRGATAVGFPIVQNDGIIALTRQRLVFHTLTGKAIEIPVTDIVGVREAKVFNTAVTAVRLHLVIQTASGEIGFYVADNAAWIASLATVGARPGADPGPDVRSIVRRRRTAKAIVAVVFTSLGLVLALGTGISAAVVAGSVSANTGHAEGTVVDLVRDGRGYDPVVEYALPERGTIRFTGWVGSSPPAFRVGEHVPVRYNPDNPQDAVIDTYGQIWFIPTLLGIFCATFLLVGIGLGVATLAARRADTALTGEPRRTDSSSIEL